MLSRTLNLPLSEEAFAEIKRKKILGKISRDTQKPLYQTFAFFPFTWLFDVRHKCPDCGSKLNRHETDANAYGSGFAIYVCRSQKCEYTHANEMSGPFPF